MKTLFHLTTEELSQISVAAEFDEDDKFIIDETNCIHRDGIIIFKKPVYIRFTKLQTGVLDKKAIVKEAADSSYLYMFAITESDSTKDRNKLDKLFLTTKCNQYSCFGMDGFSTGWQEELNYIW